MKLLAMILKKATNRWTRVAITNLTYNLLLAIDRFN